MMQLRDPENDRDFPFVLTPSAAKQLAELSGASGGRLSSPDPENGMMFDMARRPCCQGRLAATSPLPLQKRRDPGDGLIKL